MKLDKNLRNIIYLDTAATTPVAPVVIEKMIDCLGAESCFANPSSTTHALGQYAENIVANARKAIAKEFNCRSDEIIFTSGATEANNIALRGIALGNLDRGKHIITSAIEHKAVLECCRALEDDGFDITYLQPNLGGWIEPETLKQALRSDTILVSLMHTNNETGVQQPLLEITQLLAKLDVLFHVDAAQAAGKFKIDLSELPIDLLSISAHKFHGPKGIGCLVIKNRRQLKIKPICFGGGQEHHLRPGTLATHQIIGLSSALELAAENRDINLKHVQQLKTIFLQRLSESLTIMLHGDLERSSPYIVNLSIAKIGNDALINQLLYEIAISTGTACSSGTIDASYVLRSMGIKGDDLYGAIRVSFSADHTLYDIQRAADLIIAAVRRIEAML